jgi:hypothetical protein
MIQSLSILVVRWLSTLLLFHVPSTTTSSSCCCCCCCCCSTLLCFHRRTLPAPRKSTRSLGGSVDYLVVSFFTILFCFVALNPLLSLSRSLALSAVVSFGHLENFTLFFTDTLPLVSFVSLVSLVSSFSYLPLISRSAIANYPTVDTCRLCPLYRFASTRVITLVRSCLHLNYLFIT